MREQLTEVLKHIEFEQEVEQAYDFILAVDCDESQDNEPLTDAEYDSRLFRIRTCLQAIS